MPRFTAERRVAAAPEKIFARLDDLGSLAGRSRRVSAVERLDADQDAPLSRGARWRIEGDFGPFARAAEVEMIEHVACEAVSFQSLTRGWRIALRLRLTEREPAACRLCAVWELDPIGLAAMSAAPAVSLLSPMMQAGLARALGKVAKSLEEA